MHKVKRALWADKSTLQVAEFHCIPYTVIVHMTNFEPWGKICQWRPWTLSNWSQVINWSRIAQNPRFKTLAMSSLYKNHHRTPLKDRVMQKNNFLLMFLIHVAGIKFRMSLYFLNMAKFIRLNITYLVFLVYSITFDLKQVCK